MSYDSIREKENMAIRSLLMDSGIPCETSQLAIGDFLWVARRKGAEVKERERGDPGKKRREKLSSDNRPREAEISGNQSDVDVLVLDCIVERKTSADLAASIVDGRYQEQKVRLRNCGCRCLLYIVEGLSLSVGRGKGYGRLNAQSLEAALISTQV